MHLQALHYVKILLYKKNKNKQATKNCKKAKPQFLSQTFPLNSIWRLLVCSDFATTMGNF